MKIKFHQAGRTNIGLGVYSVTFKSEYANERNHTIGKSAFVAVADAFSTRGFKKVMAENGFDTENWFRENSASQIEADNEKLKGLVSWMCSLMEPAMEEQEAAPLSCGIADIKLKRAKGGGSICIFTLKVEKGWEMSSLVWHHHIDRTDGYLPTALVVGIGDEIVNLVKDAEDKEFDEIVKILEAAAEANNAKWEMAEE